ncbi:N-acetyltransferase [Devosia yakushimensis]|uniref:N-acetyltransferase n=1 Tax=Devosia yakushimensis TaxID=470028 RepID=A0ABQ5U9M9_9HYPH|nr:GNAT family N-acetyltransferase [Devosia yakushimensis]GLQ08420.1 N-acetyltransferase [Devosia yakushimensis]
MTETTIRLATESDAAAILKLLQSVALWLETDGPGKLWPASSFKLIDISAKAQRSEILVLTVDEDIAGCLYMEESDDAFWPEALPGEALYLHKIAVDRAFAGRGFARQLIDWAAQHAAQKGLKFLRLDCAPRPRLVQVYRDAEFERVGEDALMGGFLVARLQRAV